MYLTTFKFKNESLILGDLFNVKIIEYPSYCNTLNPFLIYYKNKGLVLYNVVEDTSNKTVALYKSYFEESCSSFEIIIHELITTKINFAENIVGGINDTEQYFMITEIPIFEITLYKTNIIIMPGNTVYNTYDEFYFTVFDCYNPIVIKFKNIKSNYTCNAIIKIFHYQIEIKDKSHICIRDPGRPLVNNITNIDLNKTYDMNKKQKVEFYAEFNSKIEKKDLIYEYSNTIFQCSIDTFIRKKISCELPINFDLFSPTKIKYDYNIYSYLSCTNKIYVGSIFFEDPYLIEIIHANNLTKISETFPEKYDASKKIIKFSVDMINYFYWFASFGFCDDYYIKSGECCKEQILTEWEVISHKKYSYINFILIYGE